MEKTMILNNGVEMPRVGFGTFMLKDPYKSVIQAIEEGYRLIDTAYDYMNEEEIGRAIRDSSCARDDIFLTSKVWFRFYEQGQCYEQVLNSLERLQTDYLDLCLLHWPFGNYYAAWRDLEKLYAEEKIRAIGVSNFNPDRLYDLIYFNTVTPAVDQVETHVFCQRKEEHEWFAQLGVAHQAYSPLAAGRRQGILETPLLVELAEKYHKTPAQIALRYLLQKDISIIPRTNDPGRARENISLFDFEISKEDELRLADLDEKMPVIGTPEKPEKVKRALTTYR